MVAEELLPSILEQRPRNSDSVMSEVQQRAEALVVPFAGENGFVHLAARSGRRRMSVVVWRSHWE